MAWARNLYIIQSAVTGSFKIGRTSNVEKRICQLQTSSPYPLRLVVHIEGAGNQELALHKRLRDYRIRDNGEWFDVEGMAELPEDIYEQIDLESQDWWLTPDR
tara:strand:- start:5660 stop:5968 length:309 start_codon:yes stop_codon:yes gene_type:complete